MKNQSTRWWGCVAGIIFAGLCLLAFSGYYFSMRARAFNSRPLVLIHNPVNHDRVQTGDAIIVHATARDDVGIQRMEVWMDDQLIAAQDAPVDVSAANMTLSRSFFPNFDGTHVITVRAVSMKGVDGQATVMFDMIGSSTGEERVVVREGETLESIAADYEVSPDELAASNPDLGSDGLAAGDELVIPDAPLPPDGSDASGAGDPPPAEVESPGSTNPLLELLGFAIPFTPPAEPTSLRVEMVGLRTWQSFDSLHCYMGLGDGSPAWFPDSDHDQTTDESFAPLTNGWWDVEPYLAGGAAPFITWPENRALPLNVSCVGIAGGGTDAIDLGRMELDVSPADWDGARHAVEADGEGGHILMEYRITRTGDTPRGIPLELDSTMTSPGNVRLDDRRISLRWDYVPLPEEEPIDGFRIYLNNTLQWIEPADARESGLPYEWFNPPCGSTYVFSVTAFRHGFPDGPESMPGAATVETPLENCHREIQIIYHTLETFDLGSDNSPRDIAGDVGPAYGYFFANEHQLSFSSGSADDGGGSLDMALGLNSNTVYDLSAMAADRDWRFSSITSDIVEIPVGGSFQIGFHIMDSDRNSDQLICEGMSMIYDDSPVTQIFDRWHDESIRSDDGRCLLSYSFGPASGSPVGSGVAGDEPLPWINLEEVVINDEIGSVTVNLRNTGTATWPWKDLDLRLQSRDGEIIATQTKSAFVLETGQETIIEFPAGTLSAPYDACVVIDPEDKVLELYERSEMLYHVPVCPPVPDLIISDVHFTAAGGPGALEVVVQNIGDGALESRRVAIRTFDQNGDPLYIDGSWPDITLRPGEQHSFFLSGVTQTIRDRMGHGYSAVVNPDQTLIEENTSNNSFDVVGKDRIELYWQSIQVPQHYRNSVEYVFDAYAVSGDARRQLVHWRANQNIDWGTCFDWYYCFLEFDSSRYTTGWFDIYGDEVLEVRVTLDPPGRSMDNVVGTESYAAADAWGAGPRGLLNSCSHFASGSNPASHYWTLGYYEDYAWAVRFNICLESAGYGE